MKPKNLILILSLSCAGEAMCSKNNDTPAAVGPAANQANPGEAAPAEIGDSAASLVWFPTRTFAGEGSPVDPGGRQ